MDKIDELLTRGVEKIIPTKEELEKVLRSRKKLRVYQGFDPTSPNLHIGHLVGLQKLRQWQDLGHEVIFLIGDFTGQIGDPSGKDKSRVALTHDQVLENAKTYKLQTSKILNYEGDNPILVKYNSEWLAKLSVPELAKYMSFLTYQQVIERDMFQKRIKEGLDIAVSEFLYPFMQGYDSVAMDIDVEVGGNDQLFNMMTGRDMMHKIKRKNKFVMTTSLLVDAQGKKIGKTEGNVISLTSSPNEFYSLIMTLPDEVLIKCFECTTDLPIDEIQKIKISLEAGENPMIYKKLLAFTLTQMLNDEKKAKDAQAYFEETVQEGKIPEEIPKFIISNKQLVIGKLLTESGLTDSNSEAKRLIEQGGVELNGEKITDPTQLIKVSNGDILKAGKRKYIRLSTK